MNYPIPTGKAVSYQSREIRVPADMESLNTPILSSGTVPQVTDQSIAIRGELIEKKRAVFHSELEDRSVRRMVISCSFTLCCLFTIAVIVNWQQLYTLNFPLIAPFICQCFILYYCICLKTIMKRAVAVTLGVMDTFTVIHAIYHYEDAITKPIFSNLVFLIVDSWIVITSFFQFCHVCHFHS
ncbi:hypothetical protein WA588_000437, partial [Blastocystis sp. NMH]